MSESDGQECENDEGNVEDRGPLAAPEMIKGVSTNSLQHK